jgi:hypothetical protein
LHRHSFELVRIGGKQTAGIIKDVVMVGGYQEVAPALGSRSLRESWRCMKVMP